MAASNLSPYTVGSYFINQYYKVLSETPEICYRFYNSTSTITRVDGPDIQTSTTLLGIHSLLTSLKVTKVEVTQLNAENSWNGGILLLMSGIMNSMNFYRKRKFTQAIFLAPQDINNYFVLNDVVHFHVEDIVNQHPIPVLPDIPVDAEVHTPNTHVEETVPNNGLEEETRDYANSLHTEDDSPVDKYSLPVEQQYEELQSETVVKEAPVEEAPPPKTVVTYVEDPVPVHAPVAVHADEHVGESKKLSYASILQAAKGQSSQSLVPCQPAVRQSMPTPPPLEQRIKRSAQQTNPSVSVHEASGDVTYDGLVQEVEPASVYVRNLPLDVTNADIEKEFKNFGKIKPNGVFIRIKKEFGICFAFVEFEDMKGVLKAIQASPIELLGRQIYIEGRRASSNSNTRGGAVARGKGRGRDDYQSETSRGRGNNYNGVRGNGFQQHAYQ